MSWLQQWNKAGQQVADCVYLAAKYTLPWWGESIAEFPTPLVPPVEALYGTHECVMKYRLNGVVTFAPARHVCTNYPEISICNLTAKVGDNEVGRLGVHPYDVRAHFWASQMAFWESRALVNPALIKAWMGALTSLLQSWQSLRINLWAQMRWTDVATRKGSIPMFSKRETVDGASFVCKLDKTR